MKKCLITSATLLLALLVSGCVSKHVIRDRAAWETAAAFVNNLVVAEQNAVTSLMARSCKCDMGLKWVAPDGSPDSVCADAAETLVVVRARWAWHYQMMLFNAGTVETRPANEAPPIPEAASLCEEMSNGQ